MKYARCLPTLAFSLACPAVFAAPINLVTNGGFEAPALPGNGDIVPTNPAFNLPGWTVPAGGNQFFLEFGQPFGGPRYLDGRQAVLLNCDGTPCAISQTLNVIPGHNYTLTFGESEEHTNWTNSPTVVRVDVGGVQQDFALGNNNNGTNGYKIFSLDFTAAALQTNLVFTDITPGSAPIESPFLDSISVVDAGTPPPPPPAVPVPATGWLLLWGLVGLVRKGAREARR